MFGSFDISASALNAQRIRINTIASNIASFGDPVDPKTGAGYRRLFPVFEPATMDDGSVGVRVSSIQQDQSPFNEEFDPHNPFADERGYVQYPNVDLSTEMTNGVEAFRAYEANINAIETTKSMINATLRVLA